MGTPSSDGRTDDVRLRYVRKGTFRVYTYDEKQLEIFQIFILLMKHYYGTRKKQIVFTTLAVVVVFYTRYRCRSGRFIIILDLGPFLLLTFERVIFEKQFKLWDFFRSTHQQRFSLVI